MKLPSETQLAQVLFETRKADCWGALQSKHRSQWPPTPKELRTRMHLGDVELDIAFAQARAVLKLLNNKGD